MGNYLNALHKIKEKLTSKQDTPTLHEELTINSDSERGDFTTLLSQMTHTNLCYNYYVGDSESSSSSFDEVLRVAYYNAHEFTLSDDCTDYSQQELNFLEKVIEFRRKELSE